jgi:hypothetical protein
MTLPMQFILGSAALSCSGLTIALALSRRLTAAVTTLLAAELAAVGFWVTWAQPQ